MSKPETTIDTSPLKTAAKAEDEAWRNLVGAARALAKQLDQWEKFKFQTECGPVYVSISRADPYPDSFEEITE